MNHIAMLLPREELVYQARLQARGHDAVTEIRCIATEHAVEEAAASIRGGASILIARGLQALRIRAGLNVPVVSIRLTAQGIGMLLRKVRTLTDNPRPRVAMVVVDDMLCDTSCCELLFGVELQIFTYRTEEEYAQVNRTALDSCPDVIIGGDVTVEMARAAGVKSLFWDFTDDSFQEAIQAAETALQADQRNQRANAQIDALLNNTTNGYIQVSRAGLVTKCNEIMLDDLETTLDALRGRPLAEVIPGIGQDVVSGVLDGGANYSTFLHIHYQAMVAILAPIRLESGEVDGAILSCHKVHHTIQLDPAIEDGELPAVNLAQRTFDSVHHRSAAMARAVEQARLFSRSEDPILLSGPQGSEIRLLAQCIHNNGVGSAGPFVRVDCGALTEEEQVSLIFGENGAAARADGGSLFLENGELLCRAAQDCLYQLARHRLRRGKEGFAETQADVRVILGTERSLAELTREGRFSRELFFSVGGLAVEIPPLRERAEDLERQIDDSLRAMCDRYSRYHVLTAGARKALCAYSWPGNLAQVENFMERLVLTAEKRTIGEERVNDLLGELYPNMDGEIRLADAARGGRPDRQRLALQMALEEWGGSREKAAQALGISKATLWRWMKKYGME